MAEVSQREVETIQMGHPVPYDGVKGSDWIAVVAVSADDHERVEEGNGGAVAELVRQIPS